MKLYNLRSTEGSTYSRRRIGRDPGSRLGGTSIHGRRGARSRFDYKERIEFEGSQMPLQHRVPKGGFKDINRKEYFTANLSVLQTLAGEENFTKIGIAELVVAGLTNGKKLVKILGNGKLAAKIDVGANAFSKTAEETIKAVDGNTTRI